MFKRYLAVILFICMTSVAYAADTKDLQVTIKLEKIQAAIVSERTNDEIYFSITQYNTNDKPAILRVPEFPMHWLNKELPKLTDVTLWEGVVKENSPIRLIISLIEQDLPPWDVDDHIGSVQLKLINKDGKLVQSWGQPNFIDQPKVTQPNQKEPKFIMLGNDSKYTVAFKVLSQ